jgi:DNA-binding NarL/FixJ family response regulator
MSLVGQLADLSLDDILKIIHLSRKSGRLTVSGHGQEWTIAFWHGELVRLSSELVIPALIAELQLQAVLDPVSLDNALKLLSEDDAPYLGQVLIKGYGVSVNAVNRISLQLAERFLGELTAWREGAFSFDLWEGETDLPPAEGNHHLLLGEGLDQRELGAAAQNEAGDTAAGQTPSDSAEQDESGEYARAKTRKLSSSPVWFVDDDPCLRQELGNYLRQRGLTVELFETAADFWISLKKARLVGVQPVAIIDLIMPRLNGEGLLGGLELLEKVCSTYPDMRVLPLSDHRCSDAESKVWDMGMPEIFSKPRNLDMRQEGGRQALAALGQTLFSAINSTDAPVAIPPHGIQAVGDDQLNNRQQPKDASPFRNSPGLHLLKGMLEELHNPALGGGIILLVLRFASEVMNRAVIFSVKEQNIVGIGQFGVDLPSGATDEAIRNIIIPRDGDSIFSRMLSHPCPMRSHFDGQKWDDFLCRALGDVIPEEIFLGPIISEGRVVAILYGDNLPDYRPVGNTEALEIFLSQAGLAMEKALLEGRLLGAHSA